MAQPTISDLIAVAASNTDYNGIGILGTNLVSTADDAFRMLAQMLAGYSKDLAGLGTVGGTANAITLTASQPWAAFANGLVLAFKNTVGPNTGATTLAVTNSAAVSLGTKAIRLQGDTALVGGEMLANGIYLLRYDTAYNSAAGAWVLLNVAGTALATNAQAAAATSTAVALTPANLAQERGYSNNQFINLSLVASVGSSALTVAIKGQDGNDPSATNPVYVSFRSVTLTSGANAQLALTAATSIVVSSGSTLGSTSAVATTYALAVFNDAGTARLGIINPVAMPLVDGIASSTAEGGAGAADSAGVWYTGTAATSKAYTIVGFITATEATAGTWATAPSTVQVGIAPAVANQFSRITLGTAVAATSGTAVSYTSVIPLNTKRITFSWRNLSTTGTVVPLIQLGVGGVYTTTGYLSGSTNITSASITAFTTGFGISNSVSAAYVQSGSMIISLIDPATFEWSEIENSYRSDSTAGLSGAGTVALSGPVDSIRIITTDAFDGGKVNITVE